MLILQKHLKKKTKHFLSNQERKHTVHDVTYYNLQKCDKSFMLSHLFHFTSCKRVIKTEIVMCQLKFFTLIMQLHFLLSFLILQEAVDAVRTFEEAKRLRESLVKSMLNPLPKDGKIRLIGGENEYEGNMPYSIDT